MEKKLIDGGHDFNAKEQCLQLDLIIYCDILY